MVKFQRTPATLAATIGLALTLIAAGPAAADAVRRQQLTAPVSAELTSGFSTSLAGDNLKSISGLTPELRRAYDSSWNRYSYVLNNPIALVDPDGRAPAGALTEQAIRRDMTPAQVQQFNAIQARVEPKIVAGGMAVGAAIAVATPEMAAGAGIGFVTSVASVSGSDAPAETKMKAVVAGTATGYITGPWDFSLPGGLISAVGSRAVADKISGQPHMSGGEAAVESINGAAANFIASAIPGLGPLVQIAVAGLSKYALDQGANAALSGESQGLTKQSVPVGTNDWINQRRDELRQGD